MYDAHAQFVHMLHCSVMVPVHGNAKQRVLYKINIILVPGSHAPDVLTLLSVSSYREQSAKQHDAIGVVGLSSTLPDMLFSR